MTITRLCCAMILVAVTTLSSAAVMLNTSSADQTATATAPVATTITTTKRPEQSQLVNRIVAIVNNDVITQFQLNLAMVVVQDTMSDESRAKISDAVLERQVLKQLITRRLQLQLAASNHIVATDDEIDSRIADLAKQQKMTVEAFYRAAPGHGFSKKRLRKQIEDNVIIEKLIRRAMQTQIHISDQDIDNYLHQLAHDPRVQKSYHVQDILISLPATPSAQQITQAKDKAQVLVKRLRQGGDFNKISAADSQASNALQGGDLGWLPLGELPDAFEKVVVNMKASDISEPIRTANGFHIIKLTAIRGLTPGSALIQVEVRQIVLKPTAKRSAQETVKLAQRLRREVIKGSNFDQLAVNYSQGGYAKKGGYVGWIDPNRNYPHFTKDILALNPGQLTPILTDNSRYYLIEVMSKRKAFSADKDERAQVKQLLYRKQMIEQMQTWLNQLHARAYINVLLPTTTASDGEKS